MICRARKAEAPMTPRLLPRIIASIAGLLTLGGLLAVACGADDLNANSTAPAHLGQTGTTPSTQTLAPPRRGSDVFDFQLVSATTGWAIMRSHSEPRGTLLLTDDGGKTWRDISPPFNRDGYLRGAAFEWENLGVAAYWEEPDDTTKTATVQVWRTTDGGASWGVVPLVAPDALHAGLGLVSIDFVDERNGWILLTMPSSSNFSFGEAYRTTDGGATWRPLPLPPTGGEIAFVNPDSGFLAGGPTGASERIYSTQDGGETWSELSVPDAPAIVQGPRDYGLPHFLTAETALLPVAIAGSDGSAVVIYSTSDAGATWSVSHVSNSDRRGAPILAADVAGEDVIIAVNEVELSVNDGTAERRAFTGIAAGRAILELQFVDAANGWARTYFGECQESGSSSNCSDESALYSTSDGGHTWTQVTPRF